MVVIFLDLDLDARNDEQAEIGELLGDLLLNDRSSNFQQMDYTPQDIAEYVFWTGDERGVADAVGEFLKEGLVSYEIVYELIELAKLKLLNMKMFTRIRLIYIYFIV